MNEDLSSMKMFKGMLIQVLIIWNLSIYILLWCVNYNNHLCLRHLLYMPIILDNEIFKRTVTHNIEIGLYSSKMIRIILYCVTKSASDNIFKVCMLLFNLYICSSIAWAQQIDNFPINLSSWITVVEIVLSVKNSLYVECY